MRVRSLCWKDSLEEYIATHSSIIAWRIPWIEEPGGVQSMGSQRVKCSTKHTWHMCGFFPSMAPSHLNYVPLSHSAGLPGTESYKYDVTCLGREKILMFICLCSSVSLQGP